MAESTILEGNTQHIPIESEISYADYKSKLKPVVSVGGTVGSGKGEFSSPFSLAVDLKTDNIYIADKFNNRVQVFDREGKYLFEFGDKCGYGHMAFPLCITVYNQRVFVVHSGSDYLLVYDLNGHFITRISSRWNGKRENLDSHNIAICPTNGDFYLCDQENNRIRILLQEMPIQMQLGDGLLYSPRSIQLTKDLIYVLTYLNPFLFTFNYDGMLVKNTVSTSICKYLKTPLSFVFDTAGNFIISDYNNTAVLVFDQHGQLIHKITEGIFSPVGVALDSEGRIVVGVRNRFRIY